MPVLISVVLGLPTDQDALAEVGAVICSNLQHLFWGATWAVKENR